MGQRLGQLRDESATGRTSPTVFDSFHDHGAETIQVFT
jgi:hypothetical protein